MESGDGAGGVVVVGGRWLWGMGAGGGGRGKVESRGMGAGGSRPVRCEIYVNYLGRNPPPHRPFSFSSFFSPRSPT